MIDDVHLSGESLQAAIDSRDLIGTWDWHLASARIQAEPLVALLFGVDPDLAEEGAPLSAFSEGIHPDDRKRVDRLVQQSLREGCAYVAEYRVMSADGVVRWVLARGHFETDDDEWPIRGRGIVIDITQLRREETGGFETPIASLADPLERIAEHCIATGREIARLRDERLRSLLGPILAEVGRRIARRLQRGERPPVQ